jgi:excinuclease ABC subunit A
LLYARLGELSCYQCGAAIRQQSPEQIVESLMGLPEGTRLIILAPMVRGRKGQHRDVIDAVRKAGFVRARIDGTVVDLNEAPELVPQKAHNIEAVVDRAVIREGMKPRLAESIQLAVRHGEGLVMVCREQRGDAENAWTDELYSTEYACPNCKISYEEIEPRTFSFNSPCGACPVCEGLGTRPDVDSVSSADSAQAEIVCPACGGARLRPEARSVRIGGRAIHEATAANVSDGLSFFSKLVFAEKDQPIAQPLLSEINARLTFMDKVGLNYLTLDRPAATLSGGELQRVRLASGLGSGLVGVCYVLDEPSIGLHPRDNDRLIESLRQLQSRGNTVLVVEHDEAIMRRADWLLDLGPGAGKHGGQIVALGTPTDVSTNPTSLTGRYLAGTEQISVPAERRKANLARAIILEGVTTNNLKNVSVKFPLSTLICVTGVSGSGKSSLLNETLARALHRRLGNDGPKPGPHTSLRGVSQIDKLIEIDQSPIGRTPRSNPATYTGIFDEVRKVFANTREARAKGFNSGRFSFNIKGGRCEECRGHGQSRIEMNFLPDLYVPCEVCQGKRFNRQTLEIRYRDLSIADVLDLRVDDAIEFFQNFQTIARLLKSLQEVGLGYITLGQSSVTLSGGEAQRIKLANELGRVDTGKTFYILDEPTTGLHFDDIRKLLAVLGRLVDLGNTVAVIEHNIDVMKTADWIIDLGPEGGAGGGQVTATGTPEEVAAMEGNITGKYLRQALHG